MLDEDLVCPRCGIKGQIFFTGSLVDRGVVWVRDKSGCNHEASPVPLARCRGCRRRVRVLPEEILPRKTFSLPVIEKACRAYTSADPLGPGLRKVVNRMGKDRPVHSTLHRWLSGLGEKTLDRLPSRSASFIPTAALIAETARRWDAGIQRLWRRRSEIPFWKYKSVRRREQLEASARLLSAASSLFSGASPLTAWNGWLISRLHVAAWSFPTFGVDTPMQLTPPRKKGVGTKKKKGDP